MSDTIGLQPTILLVPPSLETAARDLLGVQVQVNDYLTDNTQWYIPTTMAQSHLITSREFMAAQAFKTLWVNDVRTTCHSPTKKEAPSFNNLLKERIK